MQLVVFDLIPTLLSWEGRNPGEAPAIPEQAGEALNAIFPYFRLLAIADGEHTGLRLRQALEDADLDGFFETIGTSAEFGPAVSPRVIRRIATLLGVAPDEVVVVTGRPGLADAMGRARMAVVLVEGPEAIAAVPEALEALHSGRFNP